MKAVAGLTHFFQLPLQLEEESGAMELELVGSIATGASMSTDEDLGGRFPLRFASDRLRSLRW